MDQYKLARDDLQLNVEAVPSHFIYVSPVTRLLSTVHSLHLSCNQFPDNSFWNKHHLNFSLPEIYYLHISILHLPLSDSDLFVFQT